MRATRFWGRAGRLRQWLLVLFGAASLLLPAIAQAYAVTIQPASQTVGLGAEVTLAVRVSDVQPGGLGSYDFRFNFDNAVLAFDRFSDGLGLGFAFGLGVTNVGSSLLIADFSLETQADLLALQPADFTLFTLVFDAVAVGTSALDLTNITLSDAAGNIVAFTADTGAVTVQAATDLPEPASWALVAGAVAASLVASRRNKASRF